jgi:hypothetical protein
MTSSLLRLRPHVRGNITSVDAALTIQYHRWVCLIFFKWIKWLHHHHHHQPINVPTAGAQAFLMDCTYGKRAITHHAGPVRVSGLDSYLFIFENSTLLPWPANVALLDGREHRLSINRPTKCGKENSRSDGHCHCERDGRPFARVPINIWNNATYWPALVKNKHHFVYKWH